MYNLARNKNFTIVALLLVVFILTVLNWYSFHDNSVCYVREEQYKSDDIVKRVSNQFSVKKPITSSFPATRTVREITTVSHDVTNDLIIGHKRREEQIKRKQVLRDYCKNNPNLLTKNFKVKNPNIIYSDKASVIYCFVPKVACTNWKRIFNVFDGKLKDPMEIKDKSAVHEVEYNSFKKRSVSDIGWRQNMYYSFLFVRHPFERLLSAYRNKLQDPYNTQYQQVYGTKILRMLRKNLTDAEYKAGKNVTFREFVEFITTTYKKYPEYSVDQHWNAMHKICNPCRVKYDFIGKMDSLIADSDVVLKELGWNDRVKFPVNAKDKYKSDIKTLVREYFGQIPKYLLKELYEVYKDDFIAFGYTTEGYF